MNIQDVMQGIHHQYGVSEMANYEIEKFVEGLIKQDRSERLILHNVGKRYSEDDMINAAKYGYEYRNDTSFPDKDFDSNCKNNAKQWLTTVK